MLFSCIICHVLFILFSFFFFFFRKEIDFSYYAKSYHVTYSHSNAPDIIPEMFSERKSMEFLQLRLIFT